MWATKEMIEGYAKQARETERILFWPTKEDELYLKELAERDKIVWCDIIVNGKHVWAMHNKTKDIMIKMNMYEQTKEVWNKDEYIFDHYLTLMEM